MVVNFTICCGSYYALNSLESNQIKYIDAKLLEHTNVIQFRCYVVELFRHRFPYDAKFIENAHYYHSRNQCVASIFIFTSERILQFRNDEIFKIEIATKESSPLMHLLQHIDSLFINSTTADNRRSHAHPIKCIDFRIVITWLIKTKRNESQPNRTGWNMKINIRVFHLPLPLMPTHWRRSYQSEAV